MKSKKFLSVILVVLMILSVSLSTSFSSFADDEIAYSFSQSKWDWWGTAQGTVNGTWGQNDNALTRNFSDGAVTYDVVGISDTLTAFQQIQDKWQSLPAGDFYLNFTNNSTLSVEVKIVASATLFDVWVNAGETKKIEFTNETAANFSVFVMNWNTTIPGGLGLFTFSPIYIQPDEEVTTVETTINTSGKEVVYPFVSANHNFSKTEGCNPNASWAWGSFATTAIACNSDGSANLNVTAGAYDKYRQLQSNWNNVPAESSTTYIDISNNTTRRIKVKITVAGYTTPDDSALPYVKSGETLTIELGALTGGTLKILILDEYGQDQIPCGENAFTFSGIYKKSEEPTAPTLYDVNLDGETYQISAGSQFDLPMNEDADFVGYFDGTNFYNSSESITVNEPMIISSVSFTLSMESGASIRYSDPTGMRFYTNLDKDTLAWLEESGATVQLGTIISPADLLGTENLSLDMSAKYIDVPFEVRDWFVEDDFSGFVGSIAKIKTENLNRNFVGRGYAKITFGDFEKTVYASYADNDISNNSRTICYIANALKNSDTYNSLTDARKAIVDSYASSYAE